MKTIRVKVFKNKKKLEKSFSKLDYNQICYCRKENVFYKTCGSFIHSSFWIEEIDNPFKGKNSVNIDYKDMKPKKALTPYQAFYIMRDL